MKKIFQAYAAYNKSANDEMLSILEKLPEEQIFALTGAYYSSIFDALHHIFFSNDLFFLKLFNEVSPGNSLLPGNMFGSLDEPGYKAITDDIKKDYKLLFRYRKDMDDTIIKITGSLNDEMLNLSVTSYNSEGDPKKEELWKTLLALFNHQTHHRGQITAFMDQFKVENDFTSSAWDKI